MEFARVRWLVPAVLMLASPFNPALAGPKATAQQVESQTVVDEDGRPVKTGELALPNYSTPTHALQNRESRASAAEREAAFANTTSTAPPGQRAFTSFASLGGCLGCSGLPVFQNQGRVEVFASTTGMLLPGATFPEPPNDFWYALTYNSNTSSFNQVFVSERVPGGIAQLILLPAALEQDRQLAVCGIDGSIRFYSAATKALLASETLQFSIQNVFRCAIGDFAHTGHSQYLLASRNQAVIFDHAGNVVWTLPAPANFYNDILVGQMDQDPALEIAVSEYIPPSTAGASPVTIYDGATHTAQLALGSGALPAAQKLALAHVGTAGTPALIVSEGWNAVHAFDTRSGAQLWKMTTLEIESLLVTRLPGRTGDQVLIGDAQWGSVHVVDGTTGVEHLAIANPEWGVTQMAVGNIGTNGATELIWGGDAGSSGPQRLVVANPVTQKVIATSRDLDTDFTTPAIGHLLGGTSRQVVFASRTTDSAFDPGTLVVEDATSGQVIAIQDVPHFQGWGSEFAVRVTDINGDGIDEILVADTHLYAGAVDVYDLTADHKFILKSTTLAGYASPAAAYPEFTALAVGNGDRKVGRYAVVGFTESNASRGPTVPTIIGLDLSTGSEKWRVPLPGIPNTYGPSPNALEALGRDATGAELFAVLRSEPANLSLTSQISEIDIVRVSGGTATVLASYQGLVTSMGVLSAQSHELIAGTFDGQAIVLQLKGTTLTAFSSHSVSSAPVDAIQAGGDGQVWIVSAQRAQCVNSKGQVLWSSTDNGYTAPAGLTIDASNEDLARVWVSSVWRVDGYRVGDFDRD